MVVLAHIKEQSCLSLGSYGRPRMTEELNELDLNIGHRRVERSEKYKVTTDSNHAFNIAPNLPRVHHTDRGSQYCVHDY